MFSERFVAQLRSFSSLTSRRRILGGAVGALVATSPLLRALDDIEAKNKHGHHKKNRKKKYKNENQGAEPTPTPSPPPPTSPEPPPSPPSPPAPPPVIRADATCPNNSQVASIDAFTDVTRFAQTFTAQRSGFLVSGEFRVLNRAGSPEPYFIRLSPIDAAGVPTHAVLAEGFLAGFDVPGDVSTISIPFGNPFAVVAGTHYALVLTRPGAEFFSIKHRVNNSCDGKAFVSPDQSSPYVEVVGEDFVFTTFVLA